MRVREPPPTSSSRQSRIESGSQAVRQAGVKQSVGRVPLAGSAVAHVLIHAYLPNRVRSRQPARRDVTVAPPTRSPPSPPSPGDDGGCGQDKEDGGWYCMETR
eukprot:GHVU01026313.1.p1 GENE.GHVU01026313.1~~GHVU01026313.1.p1  ORF type:complete len:103 (-),score=8.27 GHVU01026313.1:206-514(-)